MSDVRMSDQAATHGTSTAVPMDDRRPGASAPAAPVAEKPPASGTPDTTAMARAMFEAHHAQGDRVRNWDTAPQEDAGIEAGRNTWLMLAGVAAGVPTVEERAELEAKAAAEAAKVAAADEAAAKKAEAAAETARRAQERAAGTQAAAAFNPTPAQQGQVAQAQTNMQAQRAVPPMAETAPNQPHPAE
jgi:hypothetical protein